MAAGSHNSVPADESSLLRFLPRDFLFRDVDFFLDPDLDREALRGVVFSARLARLRRGGDKTGTFGVFVIAENESALLVLEPEVLLGCREGSPGNAVGIAA